MEEKTRQERCRYCHRFIGKNHNEAHCVFNGREDEKVIVVTTEDCENCGNFSSRFIEYPLTIQEIENTPIDTVGIRKSCGELCEVTLAKKDTGKKSYLGIYFGDLPIGIQSTYDTKTGKLNNFAVKNPAIYVFELKRIVYGCESWWRIIKSLDEFKGIPMDEIENTWYVRLLRDMQKKDNNSSKKE